jgi:hypothetical protein
LEKFGVILVNPTAKVIVPVRLSHLIHFEEQGSQKTPEEGTRSIINVLGRIKVTEGVCDIPKKILFVRFRNLLNWNFNNGSFSS